MRKQNTLRYDEGEAQEKIHDALARPIDTTERKPLPKITPVDALKHEGGLRKVSSQGRRDKW